MPRTKPGPGWTNIHTHHGEPTSVWDHASGIRLHIIGLVSFADGKSLWVNQWPDSAIADRCIRIAGGNRKRGLMLWALKMEAAHVAARAVTTDGR